MSEYKDEPKGGVWLDILIIIIIVLLPGFIWA